MGMLAISPNSLIYLKLDQIIFVKFWGEKICEKVAKNKENEDPEEA